MTDYPPSNQQSLLTALFNPTTTHTWKQLVNDVGMVPASSQSMSKNRIEEIYEEYIRNIPEDQLKRFQKEARDVLQKIGKCKTYPPGHELFHFLADT